jgi:hypothetical protein
MRLNKSSYINSVTKTLITIAAPTVFFIELTIASTALVAPNRDININ